MPSTRCVSTVELGLINQQSQAAFFSQLPAETRLEVYCLISWLPMCVLNDSWANKVRCLATAEEEQNNTSQGSRIVYSGRLSFLLSCRKAYSEAAADTSPRWIQLRTDLDAQRLFWRNTPQRAQLRIAEIHIDSRISQTGSLHLQRLVCQGSLKRIVLSILPTGPCCTRCHHKIIRGIFSVVVDSLEIKGAMPRGLQKLGVARADGSFLLDRVTRKEIGTGQQPDPLCTPYVSSLRGNGADDTGAEMACAQCGTQQDTHPEVANARSPKSSCGTASLSTAMFSTADRISLVIRRSSIGDSFLFVERETESSELSVSH
ncbi:hypothetical protein SCUP234_00713 [Seiridium cupressi]